ncbi:hypothetical protein, partial [Herminiimonas sp. CN]|uniref:hypothetical protein n=1 Tax=Herminiimonas sp. CN TaxID=1349818 RepID=UPI001EE6921D
MSFDGNLPVFGPWLSILCCRFYSSPVLLLLYFVGTTFVRGQLFGVWHQRLEMLSIRLVPVARINVVTMRVSARRPDNIKNKQGMTKIMV